MVYQVLFNANVAGEHVMQELLGEARLIVQHPDHFRLLQAHRHAVGHRSGRGHARRLAGKASLADEIAPRQKRDHRLFALVGNNGEFQLALLDLENRVGRVALRE